MYPRFACRARSSPDLRHSKVIWLTCPSAAPSSASLPMQLEGYTMTKSSLHFSIDRPLPKALVKKLITVRLADAGLPPR